MSKNVNGHRRLEPSLCNLSWTERAMVSFVWLCLIGFMVFAVIGSIRAL